MNLLHLLIIAQGCAQETSGGGENAQGGGIMGTIFSFLPFVLIFVVFYFLLIYPESKKRKKHKQMLETVQKDDKVLTTGGILGLVKNVKKDVVVVKIADKVDIEISRSAIVNILNKEEQKEQKKGTGLIS